MAQPKISEKTLFNLSEALDAVRNNTLRSILTALGIIFGVAAVIAMMAIGSGAKQEILDQMKLVGVNNIIISGIENQDEIQSSDGQEDISRFTPGLNLLDISSINEIIPGVQATSPELIIECFASRNTKGMGVKLIGVDPEYFEIFSIEVMQGSPISESHNRLGSPVCVIGRDVAARIFPDEDPIGKKLKCGDIWYEVIGVLEPKLGTNSTFTDLGLRNSNQDIFIPIETALLRMDNRNLITQSMIEAAIAMEDNDDDGRQKKDEKPKPIAHQVNKIIVQVHKSEELVSIASIIGRMFKRRHNNIMDFEISIPEEQLKQEQRSKEVLNWALIAIAGISLLVGGIGIMNIMLASVMERIREIGLRMAIGATKKDIIMQFLSESFVISLAGGIIGVILGVILAFVISGLMEIPTIINISSIIISFTVSAAVGLIFGIMPARKAAEQDPISSLRHD